MATEKTNKVMYSVRIDKKYEAKIDFIRMLLPGGLSEFISRKLDDVQVDEDFLLRLEQAKKSINL